MPIEQRELHPIINFDLRIDRVTAGRYLISAFCHLAGSTPTPTEVNWPTNWSSETEFLRWNLQSPAEVEEFGRTLYTFAFPRPVELLFQRSLAQLSNHSRLRLRLILPQGWSELNAVPWEYMYDNDNSRYLIHQPQFSLVRYISIASSEKHFLTPQPLKILVVTSSPRNLTPLEVKTEWQQLRTQLADLVKDKKVELQWCRQPNSSALFEAIKEFKPHVVHYAGHGELDKESGDGFLQLVGKDELAQALPAPRFAEMLSCAPVRLVVLNACHTAESDFNTEQKGESVTRHNQLLAVAPRIMTQIHTPAVVGMQAPITDQAALQFSRLFYQGLVRGDDLDQVMYDVRHQLYSQFDSTEWGKMVLYARYEQYQPFSPTPVIEGTCPYKGLSAYEEADAHLFFGREKLTQELVAHLQKHNFLAVVGASGSGKSSVVKAGVIPQLRKDNQWLIVPPFRPGANPFEQVVSSLLTLYLSPEKKSKSTDAELQVEERSLLKIVTQGELTLTDIAQKIMQNNPGRERLLLVVDQFEELFTQPHDKKLPEKWLTFLTEPLSQPHNQLTLLLTLRGDFYNYAIQSATLKPWLEMPQKIVPLMTPTEFGEAITGPAVPTWYFQEGLVATILEDVGQEPGILPFLSQALLKTWEARQGRQLTVAGYLASGGVKEAISYTAGQVYNQLSTEAQQVVRGLLMRLTQFGEGREDTRRRLTHTELEGLPYPPELVQEVLDKLTAAQVRLLTQDQEGVEVAHEALIRGWPLLRQWLDEDREGLRLHRQLTEAAGEWEKLGRDKSVLWRGARLAQVQGWLTAKRNLTLQERAFLEESTDEEERLTEEKNLHISNYLSVSLAFSSQFDVSKNKMLAFLLSIEGLKIHPSRSAFSNLNKLLSSMAKPLLTLWHKSSITLTQWNKNETRVLTASDDGTTKVWNGTTGELLFILQHKNRVTSAQWNGDESRIITSSEDGTVKVWDGQSGEPLLTLQHEKYVYSAQWNGEGTCILTTSRDGTVKVWDGQSGQHLFTIEHKDTVSSAQWNGEGTCILTTSRDGTVKVWDGQSGDPLLTLHHEDWVTSAQWNREGTRILTASRDGTAKVWNGQSGELLLTLSHKAHVNSAQWNKNESLILTISEGKVNVWDPFNRKFLISFPQDTYVYSARWNRQGTHILTMNLYQDFLQVWNGQSRQPLLTLQCEDSTCLAQLNGEATHILNASGNTAHIWDGRLDRYFLLLIPNEFVEAIWNREMTCILTIDVDGIAKIWNVTTGQHLFTLPHEGFVWSAKWNGDESCILTTSRDGTANVWDGITGERLFTLQHKDDVNSAQWSKDESRILTTSRDGTANVWDGITGERLFTLQHKDDVNSAQWNKDESRILTTSQDCTVYVWDGTTGERLLVIPHWGNVNSAQWNKDESFILTTCQNDGTTNVWDGTTGERLLVIPHRGNVYSAQWNRDESRILTKRWDGAAEVWDGVTGELVFTLHHKGDVYSTLWNKDESRIVTSGRDETVRIWDGQNGQLLFTLPHETKVDSAQWNPTQTQILTTDQNGVARLWDAETGELLLLMEGNSSNIVSAEWGETDSRLWIITHDGLVQAYYTDPEELIAEACSRATRNLTWEEWQTYLPGRPYRQTCPNLPVHESVPESERP